MSSLLRWAAGVSEARGFNGGGSMGRRRNSLHCPLEQRRDQKTKRQRERRKEQSRGSNSVGGAGGGWCTGSYTFA